MITVPAEYSARLAAAGATRMQARFCRVTILAGAPQEVDVQAGHAIVGYSD